MASLKEVRGRIISVNSTQQITKAMKMVAAAKLRRAQDNIIKIRPYAEKLNTILNNLSETLDDSADNPFSAEREVKNVLIIVVTSDRGLAGAFNTNVVKGTMSLINEKYKAQARSGNITLLPVGKKGRDFFMKMDMKVVADFSTTFLNL
jgi:F-type H+-transporting ATPase subunit gamma